MPIDPSGWSPPPPFQPQIAMQEAIALRNRNLLFPGEQQLQQQALQQGQIGINTSQGALQSAYKGRLDSAIAQATAGLTDPADIQKAAAGAVARGAAAGLYPSDFAAAALGGGPNGVDWTTLSKQAVLGAGNDPELKASIGTPSVIDTGGSQNTVVTRVGPQGASVVPAEGPSASIPRTLSPSEKVAGISTVTPQGIPQRTSVGAQFSDTGEANGGPIQTGLKPGVAEGMTAAGTATGQGNAQQALTLQSRAADVPARKAALENMRSLATEFHPGPQSGFWKGAGQLAAEYGVKLPGAPPADATGAQEEFDKLGVQVMALQRQQMGLPATDASSALTTGAVPNDKLSPSGIQRVAGLMEGNEDYLAAQNSAWQKWSASGRTGETFGEFQAQFNRMFDPRVFQAQYMTPDQRAKVRNQVGQDTFDKQTKALKQLGWGNGGQ